MKRKIFISALLFLSMQLTVRAQILSLNFKDAPLEKVLLAIKKQSGFGLVSSRRLLKKANLVNINVSQGKLETVLATIFKDQPLSYAINGKIISVKPKKVEKAMESIVEIFQYEDPETKELILEGTVLDAESGLPLQGASIKLLKAGIYVQTDKNGRFRIVISDQNN